MEYVRIVLGVDGVSIWVGTWREDLGFEYMKATPCGLVGWALALCLALCLLSMASNRATTTKMRDQAVVVSPRAFASFSVVLGIHS